MGLISKKKIVVSLLKLHENSNINLITLYVKMYSPEVGTILQKSNNLNIEMNPALIKKSGGNHGWR